MGGHLGYEKSERSDYDDYRNGYKRKRVNSSYGSESSFLGCDCPYFCHRRILICRLFSTDSSKLRKIKPSCAEPLNTNRVFPCGLGD